MNILKLLFSFSGRISRKNYWFVFAFWGVSLFVFQILSGIDILGLESTAETAAGAENIDLTTATLFLGFIILLAWSNFAIAAKRWHDINRTGWWAVINIVPLGVFVSLVVNGFFRGTVGDNKYGSDPLGKDDAPASDAQPLSK